MKPMNGVTLQGSAPLTTRIDPAFCRDRCAREAAPLQNLRMIFPITEKRLSPTVAFRMKERKRVNTGAPIRRFGHFFGKKIGLAFWMIM